MATKTPKIGLNKPGSGEYGWDALLNQNIDTLDALVGQLLDERAVSGTATGGSATTLVDTSASWDAGAWAGAIVVVRRGGQVIRVAQIQSNTATQLTLAASGTAIQAGDSYTILAQANAIPLVEKGAPNGVATLDGAGKVVERLSYEGAANGVATLDASGKVVQRLSYEDAPNGVPTLDTNGNLTITNNNWSNAAANTGVIVQNGGAVGAAISLVPTASAANPKGWAIYAGSTGAAIGDGSIGLWHFGHQQAKLKFNGSDMWIGPNAANRVWHDGLGQASLATAGYQKLPSGLIVQWGYTTTGTVTFPVAFPTAVLFAAAAKGTVNGTLTNTAETVVGSVTLTGMTVSAWNASLGTITSQGVLWLALGH